MKRYKIQLALLGVLPLFGGPCLPDNYFSDVLARSGIALTGTFLSDVLNTFFPAI